MAEASREKVHSIHEVKRAEKANDDMEELKRKGDRDMSRVAILISILSVLLLVVFFFRLNQDVTGLSQEIQNLGALREEMSAMGSQLGGVQQAVGGIQQNVGSLETRLVEMEKLPARTRNMIIMNDLTAMGQRLGYIGSQLDGQQAERLQEAQQLLTQIQSELGQ